MGLVLAASAVVLLAAGFWIKNRRERRLLDDHTITPEALHALLDAKKDVLVLDVRQPLDVLTDSQIIPGAKRLDPQDVMNNPSLIPSDRDSVVYCTCPSDESAQIILRQALDLNISRAKLLKGGLEAWKAKGYPVEPYTKPFHLDTGT
ncbi:MAG: rhodanese-like domain-containing protein [Silvibacterium sp.]|nr:rhodanese-like domain-containing protein [Silvibacterium sp.]